MGRITQILAPPLTFELPRNYSLLLALGGGGGGGGGGWLPALGVTTSRSFSLKPCYFVFENFSKGIPIDEYYQLRTALTRFFPFWQETPEFDLHFEKNYKWIASSIQDKNNFIIALWKVKKAT